MSELFELAPASGRPLWFVGGIVLFLVGLAAFFAYLGLSARSIGFEVTPEALRIRGGIYGRSILRQDLVLDEARGLDLRATRELQPVLRTNGLGLPGYQAGWFKLRNGRKALVHLTSRQRVVYVPTRRGYVLLMSVREPEAFLRALGAG